MSIVAPACGPATGEATLYEPALYDPLAERCGSTEPIQLLALAPNETVESNDPWYLDERIYTSVARHGDRWLIGVKTFEREFIPPFIDPEENTPNELVSSRVVSVDECGGDVRVVLEGVHGVRVPTGDEPWTACGGDQGLIAFDPDVVGSARPHPDLFCSADVVDGAFVTMTRGLEDETNWLVLARLAVDEPSDITQLVPGFYETLHVVAGSSLRLVDTADDELIEIDVLTGQQRVLRTEVSSWSASDDGRFVQWRQKLDGCGPLLLWDRERDEERALGLPEWGCARSFGISGNAVASTPEDGEPDLTQLVLLASGDELVLEGGWSSRGQVGQTYVLYQWGEPDALVFVEPGAAPSPPIVGDQRSVQLDDDRVWVFADEAHDDDDPDTPPPPRSLYELAAPAFTPRLVASGLWHPLRLADGRVVNVVDRDLEHQRGTLVLVDGERGTMEIDRDVAETLYRFNTEARRKAFDPLVDDVVIYPVRDPEHERTGVWIAQIAPTVEP